MAQEVTLGKSDVKVFPIALGTNAVGGHNLYPNLDEEQGKEVVRQAINNGITLLDTAFIYGPERSEELVGSCERIETNQNCYEVLITSMKTMMYIKIMIRVY